MRFLACLMMALSCIFVPAALAQVVTTYRATTGPVTPEEMGKRLDDAAGRTKTASPTGGARAIQIDFAWPKDEREYRALGKNVVVLLSAVSWDENELPLKRVYIRTKWNREIALERISSERSTVPMGSSVYTLLGAHREDSFYLVPAALMKDEGEMFADFAANRTAFRLYRLPADPPDFVEADRLASHAPGIKPDPPALKTMLEREYTGFKLPGGLQ